MFWCGTPWYKEQVSKVPVNLASTFAAPIFSVFFWPEWYRIFFIVPAPKCPPVIPSQTSSQISPSIGYPGCWLTLKFSFSCGSRVYSGQRLQQTNLDHNWTAFDRGGRNSFPGCTRFSWFWPQNTLGLWVILGQVYEILQSFWPQWRPPRIRCYDVTSNLYQWLALIRLQIFANEMEWPWQKLTEKM